MWLEAAKHKKSVQHDARRLDTIVEHLGARTLLTGLRAEDIDRLKQLLRDTPTRYSPAGMQPATVNRHLAVLRSALRLAKARGYQHRDPIAGVKFLPENNRRDRICSREEYERLCAGCHGELRLAILIGFYTAMRLGEITGLRWSQIDLKEGTLVLRQSQTKEADSKRVPLVKAVVEALEGAPRNIDGRVFAGSTTALSAGFGRLTRQLGIEGLRFHDLRHTAATNLRRAGVDIITLKALTGHKTIKMLERYNNVDFQDLHKAVSRFENHSPSGK